MQIGHKYKVMCKKYHMSELDDLTTVTGTYTGYSDDYIFVTCRNHFGQPIDGVPNWGGITEIKEMRRWKILPDDYIEIVFSSVENTELPIALRVKVLNIELGEYDFYLRTVYRDMETSLLKYTTIPFSMILDYVILNGAAALNERIKLNHEQKFKFGTTQPNSYRID